MKTTSKEFGVLALVGFFIFGVVLLGGCIQEKPPVKPKEEVPVKKEETPTKYEETYTFQQGLEELQALDKKHSFSKLEKENLTVWELSAKVDTTVADIEKFQEELSTKKNTTDVQALMVLSDFWKHYLLAMKNFAIGKELLGKWNYNREDRIGFEKAAEYIDAAAKHGNLAADALEQFVDTYPAYAKQLNMSKAPAQGIRSAYQQAQASLEKIRQVYGWT